jgi:hypothetical protein
MNGMAPPALWLRLRLRLCVERPAVWDFGNAAGRKLFRPPTSQLLRCSIGQEKGFTTTTSIYCWPTVFSSQNCQEPSAMIMMMMIMQHKRSGPNKYDGDGRKDAEEWLLGSGKNRALANVAHMTSRSFISNN